MILKSNLEYLNAYEKRTRLSQALDVSRANMTAREFNSFAPTLAAQIIEIDNALIEYQHTVFFRSSRDDRSARYTTFCLGGRTLPKLQPSVLFGAPGSTSWTLSTSSVSDQLGLSLETLCPGPLAA